jgi:uncharacterized ferritin-like protein (DUF455 family)
MQLRPHAFYALCLSDPAQKVEATQALWGQRTQFKLDTQQVLHPEPELPLPGRPALPRLIAATQVPSRTPFTTEGLAALLHAVCHIEFNAINLALDAVWRFNAMPDAFYADWLRVAFEESQHFDLLHTHLQSLGYQYGDFDAHDGLWRMCEIQTKLRKAASPGALRAVEILDIILRDEVGHVAIGNHWYRYLCDQRGLDPVRLYGELVQRYDAPKLKPPFNTAARKKAGFTDVELSYLLG